MKKPFSILAAAVVIIGLLATLYFFRFSKQKKELLTEPVQQDTSTTYENDLSITEEEDIDITKLIAVGYEDLPDEQMDEFRERGDLYQGIYLSEEYKNKLMAYFRLVLDTTRTISYPGYGDLKQRYFFLIYNNLPGFVDRKEQHNGYYVEDREGTIESTMLAYGIYRIDRSPQNIRKIFELLKPKLTDYVNAKLYSALEIGQTIQALINSYEFIQKLDKPGALMDSVYVKVDSVARHFDYEKPSLYGHSLNSDYGIYSKYMHIDEVNPDNSYEINWAFSFWMRRHHEKNEEEVYKILKELKEIFGKQN